MAPAKKQVYFYDTPIETEDFLSEVVAGLRQTPRSLHPKHFYDAHGSRLFDAICELPEYYPTRTEMGILQRYGSDIAAHIDPRCLLIELGSGSSQKIRLLLDALRPSVYMPLDISKDHLLNAAKRLQEDYPWLEIRATSTDYSKVLHLPYSLAGVQKVAFFPGSSIGNFDPVDALALLKNVHAAVTPNGGLLIGVDLKKDVDVLERAYNDAQGVTGAFNLNILRHINRELAADFNLDHFSHRAFYNEAKGRIEMHLLSCRKQTVRIGGETFELQDGETLHTENSYKYSVEEFQALAQQAHFEAVAVWTDPEQLFSVHYFKAR
jgi:dimethylhistidine N-methyltransferase